MRKLSKIVASGVLAAGLMLSVSLQAEAAGSKNFGYKACAEGTIFTQSNSTGYTTHVQTQGSGVNKHQSWENGTAYHTRTLYGGYTIVQSASVATGGTLSSARMNCDA